MTGYKRTRESEKEIHTTEKTGKHYHLPCQHVLKLIINLKKAEMANIKLWKGIRKTEYLVCHEQGTKKKSDSLKGIEPISSLTTVRRFKH